MNSEITAVQVKLVLAVFLFYIVNDALHANPMPFPGSDRNTVGKDGRRIGGIFFQHQQMPGAFQDRQVNTAVFAGLLPDGMHGIFQNVGKNGAEGHFRTGQLFRSFNLRVKGDILFCETGAVNGKHRVEKLVIAEAVKDGVIVMLIDFPDIVQS